MRLRYTSVYPWYTLYPAEFKKAERLNAGAMEGVAAGQLPHSSSIGSKANGAAPGLGGRHGKIPRETHGKTRNLTKPMVK